MAWIEKRGTRKIEHRVRWRENGVIEWEAFDDPDDAAEYLRLVKRAGGTRPIPQPAAALPARVAGGLQPPVAGQRCSFTRWAEYWMSGLSGLGDRTDADYRRMVRRDLIPVFGDLDVTAVDRTMVGHWVEGLTQEELKPKTIRNKHALLHQIFEAATEHEPRPMRAQNPCRRARLPRVWKSAMRMLTHENFWWLVSFVDAYYRPVVEFLAGTGLRWGELAGLQVRYVHLDGTGNIGPHINIEYALKRNRAHRYVLGRPKSQAAQRRVPIDAICVELLRAQIAGKGPDEFVFTTHQGEPLRHQNFYTRVWRPAVEAAGFGADGQLPALRIDDLRHTFVAWLLAASPNSGTLYKVSKWLGHESYYFTADRYGYLLPEEPEKEMAAITLALRAPKPQSVLRGLEAA